MFGEELSETCEVFGIGLDREIEAIEGKKILIHKTGSHEKIFEIKTIKSWEFEKIINDIIPDFIMLAVKNPVAEAVKQYYRGFKGREKIPALILSQNGLSAGWDALKALEVVLGDDAKNVQIIRLSLFNPIEAKSNGEEICITYSLPIRLCYGVYSGKKDARDLREVFSQTKIEAEEVLSKDTKNMEFSKLYLNLMGMASAIRGLPVKEGFRDPDTFFEEVESLKEYAAVVKKAKGKFLNFDNYPYPIGILAACISALPASFLKPFRVKIAGIIAKGRKEKPKDLDEIEYYNGEVVKLAKKTGTRVPINEKLLAEGKFVFANKKKF